VKSRVAEAQFILLHVMPMYTKERFGPGQLGELPVEAIVVISGIFVLSNKLLK